MLQFQAIKDGSYRVTGGPALMVVFPATAAEGKDTKTIILLSTPEEVTTSNVVSWPGEYNEAGISIRGIGHSEGQQVSYVVEADGVRCGFLSSPLQDWSDKQLESVPDIDVLVIPGDDSRLVQKLVDEFDPRVLLLVPPKEKGDFAAVTRTMAPKETVSEYKLKGSLPAEGREVYVLAA
jgi:hypothetical protein